MTEALLIAVLIVGIANLALVILLIGGRRDAARDIDRLKRDMLDEQRALRAEVSENTRRSINAVGETLLNEYQRDTLNQEQRFKTFAMENAQRMEQIRRSVERQLADIREVFVSLALKVKKFINSEHSGEYVDIILPGEIGINSAGRRPEHHS